MTGWSWSWWVTCYALLVALGVAPQSGGPQHIDQVIPVALFGSHNGNLAVGSVSDSAGSYRIWDIAGTSWRDVEPTQGKYSWGRLDHVVANAMASGSPDIVYVLGSTPQWASDDPGRPCHGTVAGSCSHPARDSYYLDYLRAVVRRYTGKIRAFQIWNEVDLPDRDFYAGDPDRLAALTKHAYEVIKSINPDATVVSPGMVPRPGRFDPGKYVPALAGNPHFDDNYLAALDALGWPVDVIAVTTYPSAAKPSERGEFIALARTALARHGMPLIPLWEVELNYDGPATPGYDDDIALVARGYIDTIRFGLERAYWYRLDKNWAPTAIRMVDGNRHSTPAADSFRTIKSWIAEQKWQGCDADQLANLTMCSMSGSGTTRMLLFSEGGRTSVPAPKGAMSVCRLPTGSCKSAAPGDMISVGAAPILIEGAQLEPLKVDHLG